jgi:CRP-like cAMP-binding protein
LGKPSNKIKDLVTLGEGQITGEISLVDQGPRSATVAAGTEPTTVQIIDRKDLETICLETPSIGYIIMRNIAIDLAFKLRHRNINEGGEYDDL